MSRVLVLRVPTGQVEAVSERVWKQPGVLGIQESPLKGGFFAVARDFEVLEFGSEAAKRCADWLESESFRSQEHAILLQVYLDPPAGFSPDAFVQTVAPGGAKLEAFQEVVSEDYLANYRASEQGHAFGENLWVGPPWATPPAGAETFIVEPGMAFGTGGHPTTQLCLERLKWKSKHAPAPRSFFDLGTGSGILAVGVRRYFPNATCAASDLDPHCAEEFDKIFRLNGMEADLPRIPRSFGPGGEASQLVAKGWRFDCVVSNIYAEVLAGIVKEISQLLVPGGAWVASGILAGVPEQTLLTAAQPYFDLVWREERSVAKPQLDKQGGLRSMDESWVGVEFKKRA